MSEQPRGRGKEAIGCLDVRARETVLPDGSESVHLTVNCPRRGTLTVSECASCPDCAAVNVNLMHQDWHVLCRRQPANRPCEAPRSAGSAMPHDFWCVHADLPVQQVGQMLLKEQVIGVVVIDAEDRPIGVVHAADVLWAKLHGKDDARVEDIITEAPAPPILHSRPIEEAAAALAKGITYLPVVDDQGVLVGVLTGLDILNWLEREALEMLRRELPAQ